MWLGVLGPMVVRPREQPVAVGASKQRVVLASLIARRNQRVAVETLVDEVWRHSPPLSAVENVRTYIRELRRSLGQESARVVTRPGGYLLELADQDLDAMVYADGARTAQLAMQGGQYAIAVEQFDRALSLWRGAALEDVPTGRLLSAYADALARSRLDATESWLTARLAIEDGSARAELRQFVADHPIRQSAWCLLIGALDDAGDTEAALAMIGHARQALDDVGVLPGAQLQALHRDVLRGSRPTTRAPLRPSQLPAPVRGFTGRAAELARLDGVVAQLSEPAESSAVVALTGMGGVGKTALALHWADRVRPRFPDGHLYLDLRGFAPGGTPLHPSEGVRHFLEALGVPSTRLPPGFDAQTSLYRSLMADRRFLVVLDNARDSEHVRPLLPGSGSSLVLVTSRNRLTGLTVREGALPLTVEVLPPAASRDLLGQRATVTRLVTEPAAVDKIVTSCGGLPLALSIVAARVAASPDQSLVSISRDLEGRSSEDGDATLDALDGGDDPSSVRSVLSWSYARLEPQEATLLRLLSRHPGPDIDLAAAASLAGRPTAQVRRLLSQLCSVSLLVEHSPKRYGCHDLVRAYAAERAQDDIPAELVAADRRLLDHYLHTADLGDRLLAPTREREAIQPAAQGVVPVALDTQASALSWFDAEWRNLLSLCRAAATNSGVAEFTVRLAFATFTYLSRRARWTEQAESQELALGILLRTGQPSEADVVRRLLARAFIQLDRHAEARQLLERVLAHADQSGDVSAQAYAHFTLGWSYEQQGEHPAALRHAEIAVELRRPAGNHALLGTALNAAGWCLAQVGDHRQAIARCQEAIAIHIACENLTGQASSLDSLGYAQHLAGDQLAALDSLQRAVHLFEKLDADYNTTRALRHLAATYDALGMTSSADAHRKRALNTLEQLDHPDAIDVRKELGLSQPLDDVGPRPSR